MCNAYLYYGSRSIFQLRNRSYDYYDRDYDYYERNEYNNRDRYYQDDRRGGSRQQSQEPEKRKKSSSAAFTILGYIFRILFEMETNIF